MVTASFNGRIIEWRDDDNTLIGKWYYKDTNELVGEYDLILINIKFGVKALKHIRENPISHFPDNTSIAKDAKRRLAIAMTALEEAELWIRSITEINSVITD